MQLQWPALVKVIFRGVENIVKSAFWAYFQKKGVLNLPPGAVASFLIDGHFVTKNASLVCFARRCLPHNFQ